VSHILYADDHEHMRLMVRDLLQSSGHEVALAPDGPTALARLRDREPDLLILDVSMPGMSGFDVCRAVKDNPFTARVPVLMLTGEADVDRKVEGFEAGADDYLAKPFDPRELRARVAALVRLVRREGDRNPTSGLPGGRAIEEELARRVAAGRPFAVGYFDIDNFKPFNDVFGFATADAVIRGTGEALREAVEACGTPRDAARGGPGEVDFVGHVGGDDFVLVTAPEVAERVAVEAARRFRRMVERAVGMGAATRGTFTALDREGRVREYPLATVSIVVLHVAPGRWEGAARLGARAAEVKRRAKQHGGDAVLVEAL
jgi:diguanylate cyclase (GGDEF)-like protein